MSAPLQVVALLEELSGGRGGCGDEGVSGRGGGECDKCNAYSRDGSDDHSCVCVDLLLVTGVMDEFTELHVLTAVPAQLSVKALAGQMVVSCHIPFDLTLPVSCLQTEIN